MKDLIVNELKTHTCFTFSNHLKYKNQFFTKGPHSRFGLLKQVYKSLSINVGVYTIYSSSVFRNTASTMKPIVKDKFMKPAYSKSMSIQTIGIWAPIKLELIEACIVQLAYSLCFIRPFFSPLFFLFQFYNKEKRPQNKDLSVENSKIVYQYVTIFISFI